MKVFGAKLNVNFNTQGQKVAVFYCAAAMTFFVLLSILKENLYELD